MPGVSDPTTLFAYNLDRQLTLTTRPDGQTFEQIYDTAGKLDFIQTPSGNVDYTYFGLNPCPGCAPGSISSIADPGGVALAFTYDGQLTTSATWSGAVSGAIQWTYDDDFRVESETVTAGAQSQTTFFGYDPDSLFICASPTACNPASSDALVVQNDPDLPRTTGSSLGLVTDSYDYNEYGELAAYDAFANGSPVFSEVLDTPSNPRDDLGRIAFETELSGGVTTDYEYIYDLRGRLEQVIADGTTTHTFTYDDNGNRLSLQTPTETLVGTFDDQDRLQTYGPWGYTYTANGELLTKVNNDTGDSWAYQYDVRGNLARVDLPNGDIIEYLVDGQNRRVGKKRNGVLEKQWLWRDQLSIGAELDGAGNLVSRFVYGTRTSTTTPEFVIQGSNTYRVIADHLGSVRALVNVTNVADIPVELDYDVFGEVSGTGAGVVPQGFAGGLYDADTGLVRFWARDYDPVSGRWVSKDPIRFGGLQTNIYAYVGNDPVNRSDPLGLYGTNDCSYYAERCAENGGSYYCEAAPWWCNFLPKPDDPDPSNEFDDEGFFRCTRQCLQDRDRLRNPSENQCGGEEPNDSGPWNPWNPSWTDHVVCYHECFADNYLQGW